jgi:hypothetical protein
MYTFTIHDSQFTLQTQSSQPLKRQSPLPNLTKSKPVLLLQKRLPPPPTGRPHCWRSLPLRAAASRRRSSSTAPVIAAVEPINVKERSADDHHGEEDAELLLSPRWL